MNLLQAADRFVCRARPEALDRKSGAATASLTTATGLPLNDLTVSYHVMSERLFEKLFAERLAFAGEPVRLDVRWLKQEGSQHTFFCRAGDAADAGHRIAAQADASDAGFGSSRAELVMVIRDANGQSSRRVLDLAPSSPSRTSPARSSASTSIGGYARRSSTDSPTT